MNLFKLAKSCLEVVNQRRTVLGRDRAIFFGSLDQIAHVQGFGLLSEEQDGIKNPHKEDEDKEDDV